MRHWRTTGNSNIAIQTGSTYISDSMKDVVAPRSEDPKLINRVITFELTQLI